MYENQSAQEVLEALGSCANGITQDEAVKRVAQYGTNELKEKEPPTTFQRFIAQLKDPMIYILFAAAFISLILKEAGDAVIILCVILLNAVVGVIQEGKAQKALDALKKMSSPMALCKRDGIAREMPAAELVPGDIVVLDAGRVIPADLRLTKSQSLKIEESALTGESVPTEKDAAYIAEGDVSIGDKHNMAFMSTAVTYGRGEGVVIGTGEKTEIGKIAKMISESKDEMTPLQKRLADLGKILGIITIVICVALFGIAVIQKRNIIEMLITAISLAVAAVPEGLPAVVTIVLAIGVQRMVRVNSIVRRLPAVETLGAVSVVCSDKTGTLTQNKMTITKIYTNDTFLDVSELKPQEYPVFCEGFVLCNDATVTGDVRIGDPTELAFIDMGIAIGGTREALEEKAPRINEQAFDSERKLMTTVHKKDSGVVAYTKGATDRLLKKCTKIFINGEIRPLTQEDNNTIMAAAGTMASQALRVLALAEKLGDETATEEDLCFVGLVGMIDPPRPEAKQAVEQFVKAGVTTVMITGDHRDTAYAIAKELGIAKTPEQCISGDELDDMTQEELNKAVDHLRVFARVSPTHKVMIVNAFKANGKIVSMTGDGVNDAPSLKAADIGVAMGITGTDVAKSAADMVLTDDNFATIEKAIEEGRGIYANIKKSVVFLLGSNLGEVIATFSAITVGLAAPLKAVHILWINLITDTLPALALGQDDKPKGIMNQPPRNPDDSLFAGGGTFLMVFYGFLIACMTLGAFLIVPIRALIDSGTAVSLTTIGAALTGGMLDKAQTYAFTILAVSQLWHAIGMRDVNTSIFRMNHLNNKMMIFAFVAGIFLQFVSTEIPLFNELFGTVGLAAMEWCELIIFAATPLLFHEIFVIIRHLTGQDKKA
ncbi:MAG: cation-translocating P-type ATPase [Oscillospiraceae bacterium]